jgi:hypothetical protein
LARSARAPVPLTFALGDIDRVPDSWRVIGARTSPLSGGPRLAVTPGCAALNLLYAFAEQEATHFAPSGRPRPRVGHRPPRPTRSSLPRARTARGDSARPRRLPALAPARTDVHRSRLSRDPASGRYGYWRRSPTSSPRHSLPGQNGSLRSPSRSPRRYLLIAQLRSHRYVSRIRRASGACR